MSIHRITGLVALILLCATIPVRGAGVAPTESDLHRVLPQAERFGAFEGAPRAAPGYRNGQLVGHVYFTHDVLRIPAYSGRPINTLVGLDPDGRIAGLKIVEHEEPILAVGITEDRLHAFTDQYRGKSAFDRIVIGAKRDGHLAIDGITGATITVMVQNATVMRTSRQVAEALGLHTAAVASPTAVARTEAAPADVTPLVSGQGLQRPPTASALAGAALGRWPAGEDEPIWVAVWNARVFEIGVLLVGLTALSLILLFQDWLARHPVALVRIRNAFLAYTLFFIGWWGLAQLSVVNVLTFTNAVMQGFRWETFLIDPMLFILWSFVAVTLLLWGRGVYCGWLCPFGALQEFMLQLSRKLRLPQLEFPDAVHERLLALKYVVLIVLFGLSLQSMAQAALYAEIEPFKTTFSMRLQREWPFVAWAAALVAISLFNRKFFCKYLCPLGAALAIPGRFRLFDWWLRRRRECGRPCQVCAHRCSVRAVRPTGEINANECHYCLDCQVVYYDHRTCVPLIDRRVRRERRTGQLAEEA